MHNFLVCVVVVFQFNIFYYYLWSTLQLVGTAHDAATFYAWKVASYRLIFLCHERLPGVV